GRLGLVAVDGDDADHGGVGLHRAEAAVAGRVAEPAAHGLGEAARGVAGPGAALLRRGRGRAQRRLVVQDRRQRVGAVGEGAVPVIGAADGHAARVGGRDGAVVIHRAAERLDVLVVVHVAAQRAAGLHAVLGRGVERDVGQVAGGALVVVVSLG